MIDFPDNVKNIFDKLLENSIYPIVVGGYIRDFLLKNDSKDIDVELYNVTSLEQLDTLLADFGRVHKVGKSFGVYKLSTNEGEIDFSLPREDTKTASGHKGFEVTIKTDLDFSQAARRRDFTINAMGYDIRNKKLLDPYNGRKDLHNKILREVDSEKFVQDPLRLLRGVGFCARFNLKPTLSLEKLFRYMIEQKMLLELPKERVFTELEKILLKSQIPSRAFRLLHTIEEDFFFIEIFSLSTQKFKETMRWIDSAKKDLSILLALLLYHLSSSSRDSFLSKITSDKKLKEEIEHLIKFADTDSKNGYEIYQAALKIEIARLCDFIEVIDKTRGKDLKKRAEELGVLHAPLPPLVHGRDLIELGLQPSKKFTILLKKCYEKQMYGELLVKEDALTWLRNAFKY